jgi:hypothetical protein
MVNLLRHPLHRHQPRRSCCQPRNPAPHPFVSAFVCEGVCVWACCDHSVYVSKHACTIVCVCVCVRDVWIMTTYLPNVLLVSDSSFFFLLSLSLSLSPTRILEFQFRRLYPSPPTAHRRCPHPLPVRLDISIPPLPLAPSTHLCFDVRCFSWLCCFHQANPSRHTIPAFIVFCIPNVIASSFNQSVV